MEVSFKLLKEKGMGEKERGNEIFISLKTQCTKMSNIYLMKLYFCRIFRTRMTGLWLIG